MYYHLHNQVLLPVKTTAHTAHVADDPIPEWKYWALGIGVNLFIWGGGFATCAWLL